MKRKFRLSKSTDFQRVRRLGNSQAHPLIVLIALPNELGQSRFGVAAGHSLGKAVQRNRAKRLIRAALQPLISLIVPGWDLIFIARRPMLEATYQQVQSAIFVLLRRAHLLLETNDDRSPSGSNTLGSSS